MTYLFWFGVIRENHICMYDLFVNAFVSHVAVSVANPSTIVVIATVQ